MPKIKIAPSILSADLSKVNREIKEVERYADLIHVDIMDGIFVPPATVDAKFVKTIRTKVPLDVHLMVHEPSNSYIKDFIKKNKTKAAISIKPKTSLDKIEKYIDIVDMVLVMTVEPGYAGQKFIQSTIPKIRELREMNPNIDIEVDGGINQYTARIAYDSGANVFVAGTSIFGKNDRVWAIKEILQSLK